MTSAYPTYVSRPSDLPSGEHHAIIKCSSFTVPGDERSRTNPGHGYGEHTETTTSIAVYATREAWVAEIERLSAQQWGGKDWVACIMRVPAVTTAVKVDVR